MSKYYIIIKINKISLGYLTQNISGFRIKPKNNIKYEGIEVNCLILINPDLIENVLRRKITKKLDAYLGYLMSVLDNDDDDNDPDDLSLVINDLNRYKSIIMNKYSKFLDVYYIRSLLSKVKFIEDELKRKMKLTTKYDTYSVGMRR